MDKEALFRNLNRRYCSKREMLPRLPLGVQPDALWQELLQSRRSRSTVLPLYGQGGIPYWYVTTERMIAASEKIVAALDENGTDFDPYTEPPPVVTLEEAFFTSYVEGAQITMQSAMDFFAGGQPPRDIEEQMLTNNRVAGKYASENLYRGIDAELLCSLAYILTDGMDNGGQDFRISDEADHASADGERFSFPAAHTVPDRVEELCAFLASPQVHPLIKAGVAQAYLFALRPFPEGNDRLGRILSGMILLRAGYTFFSDVSLSALIARKGYAYYEATANILREENGGDMTYFLEFFMDLLSRAVDERALRRQRREEQDLRAEQDMARTTLTASAEPSPSSLPDEPFEEPPEEPEQPIPTVEAPDEEGTASSTAPPEAADRPSEECMSRLRDLLHACVEGDNEKLKYCAMLLLCFLQNGKYTFTQTEFCNSCGFDSKQAARMMYVLREKGIIESSGTWDGRLMIYRFITKLPSPTEQEDDDPDPEAISDKEDLLDGFFTVPAGEAGDIAEGTLNLQQEMTIEQVRQILISYTESDGEKTKACAKLLLGYMDSGKHTFTRLDIATGCDLQTKQASNIILYFRQKGVIESTGTTDDQKNTCYRFKCALPSDAYQNELDASPDESDEDQDEEEIYTDVPIKSREALSRLRIQDELLRLTEESGSLSQKVAKQVFSFMQDEKGSFSAEDLVVACALAPSRVGNVINSFKSKRLIRRNGTQPGRYAVYEFNLSIPLLNSWNYDADVHDAIRKLRDAERSRKDWRIAGILETYMPAGLINVRECPEYSDEERLKHDMLVPLRMGIVEKLLPGIYRINRKKSTRLPELSTPEKTLLSALYRTFYHDRFTRQDAFDALDISVQRFSRDLYELRLLNLLEYNPKENRQYRLLVNPIDHPSLFADEAAATEPTNVPPTDEPYSEDYCAMINMLESSATSLRDRRLAHALRLCMDKGTISKNNYLQWGYTVGQWDKDIELAVDLGLVQRDKEGIYRLSKTVSQPHSNLRPRLKKEVTDIYKAFGDQIFTSEMFTATLNYSAAQTYASLHKLTLLRLVNQQTTVDGSLYQLLVNPEDNPECFDAAA